MSDSSWDSLCKIHDRLKLLLHTEKVYEFLNSFWNSNVFCFASNDPNYDQVNITSTCFSLFTILESDKLKSRFSEDKKGADTINPFEKISKILISAEWKSEDLDTFNIYTTPIVISALHKLNTNFDNEKIIKGLKSIIENTRKNGAASYGDYSPSAFLTYWCAKAFEGAIEHNEIKSYLRKKFNLALSKFTAWAESEVHKQLAFYSSQDMASFDPIHLAYASVIYIEGYKRDNRRANEKMISKAIEVVFSSQMSDGLWPKCHPIFHYSTRGNVYTFSFEMLDVLLSIFNFFPDVYRKNLEKLEASLKWAEQNILIHDTGTHKLKGWRSNLLIEDGPEVWSTAAVFNSLRRFKSLVRTCLNDNILTEFHAKKFGIPDRTPLNKLYDSDLKLMNRRYSLKNIIKKYLIDPHLSDEDINNRKYSAIFFGPPGTAKTWLGEIIASSLGWPFIHFQTSDFLSEGYDRVAGRARYIFEKLYFLEKSVILFDEIEEFVRDREDQDLEAQSRMITTAMLTLIQQLRRQEQTIFIITTNRLKAFDKAVTRPGRFDLILLISPPSLSEKKRQFKDYIQGHSSIEKNTSFLDRFFKFIDKYSKKYIQYFSFLEWESLINDIIDEFETNGPLTTLQLESILDRHKESITIQGELKKDYEESKVMTRVY